MIKWYFVRHSVYWHSPHKLVFCRHSGAVTHLIFWAQLCQFELRGGLYTQRMRHVVLSAQRAAVLTSGTFTQRSNHRNSLRFVMNKMCNSILLGPDFTTTYWPGDSSISWTSRKCLKAGNCSFVLHSLESLLSWDLSRQQALNKYTPNCRAFWRFITVLTAVNWIVSLATYIQSTKLHPLPLNSSLHIHSLQVHTHSFRVFNNFVCICYLNHTSYKNVQTCLKLEGAVEPKGRSQIRLSRQPS